MKQIIIFLLFSSFLNVYGQSCSTETLEIRAVRASETDDEITFEAQKHQVYINPNCPSNNKLLLHMVGTYDNPASTSFYPSLAANNGFKAISLKYPNWDSATELCKFSNDLDCYSKFHEELIYGVDAHTDLVVNPADCITNRIQKLLLFLSQEHPDESWDRFLKDSNEIDWTDIVVSGHSQGGGHAVYIAKQHSVNRVISFSSPNEFSSFFNDTAPWLSVPGETPEDQFYAFGNLFDEIVDFEEQYQCWDALNLTILGDSLNVDLELCPYLGRKILYTRQQAEGVLGPNHNLVVIDDFTPFESGLPIFLPVWEYLLDICSVSAIVETSTEDPNISIFPNPVSELLLIDSETVIDVVEVFNVQGICIKKLNPNTKSFTINTNNFDGPIFLKIKSRFNRTQSFRVIVE